jgi:hypothetical protein
VIFVALALATGIIGIVQEPRAVASEVTDTATRNATATHFDQRLFSSVSPRLHDSWYVVEKRVAKAVTTTTILHPNKSHVADPQNAKQDHSLNPRGFVAVVAIPKEQRSCVMGIKLELIDTLNHSIDGIETIHLSTATHKTLKETRWHYYIHMPNSTPLAAGMYTLKATPLLNKPLTNGAPPYTSPPFQIANAAGAGNVKPKKEPNAHGPEIIPSFDYPDPSMFGSANAYQLSGDDLNYFVAYGISDSDIGAPHPTPSIGGIATGNPSWSSADYFWFAEFDNLGGVNALDASIAYAVAAWNDTGVSSPVPYVQK